MAKLSAFLRPSPAGRTKKVYLSDDWTDENGEKLPFIVKAITPAENEQIAALCMKDGELDAMEYANRLIVACTQEPDLKATELCEYYGVMDPNDVPGIMFTVGEKQALQSAIMEINDIAPLDKKLKKAKNS